jgi:hypothetical protein
MEEFEYQLVLQLPGNTRRDFDVLVAVETSLAEAYYGTPHELDGHDSGSGTGNIFIDTNDPVAAFALAKATIDLTCHPTLRAAFRGSEEDEYTLIWPENSSEEFNVL